MTNSLISSNPRVQNGEYLSAYGSDLIENGYQIIPIPQGGKSPGIARWQNTKSNKTLLENWLKNGFSNAGIGILTRHTPCIDLDITDENVLKDILEDIEFTHGILPMRIGRAPRCLLMFRTNTPFKKMKTGKFKDEWGESHEVEILADGQQFLAHAIHPDTNKPYVWTSESTPLNTLTTNLTELTGAQCAELIKRCIRVFEKHGFKSESNSVSNKVLSDSTDDVFANISEKVDKTTSQLRAMLKVIPNNHDHDFWVKVGMALYHQYEGGNAGLELWYEWSKSASNYDAKALNTRYKSFKTDGKGRSPITARTIIDAFNKVIINNGESGATLRLINGSSIKPIPVLWIWRYWLATGKLVLLAGAAGTGKTTLAMELAAIITKGGKFPDNTPSMLGDVVIWSGEDDPDDTLVPRLIANGADIARVHFVGNVADFKGGRSFDPAKDMPILLKSIKEIGKVVLIIIDPIVSAVAGDSHKNAEVRRGLQPVIELASQIGASVIGITHFTKGTGGKDTTERVTGSLAFAALARAVLATAKDSENDGYILTRSKSNLGPDGGGFRYKLNQVSLDSYPNITASKVVWGDPLNGNARDLIKNAEGDQPDNSNESAAEGWLLRTLASGPMKANDIYMLGGGAGFSKDKLKRAKLKAKIDDSRSKFRGVSWWLLAGQTIPEDTQDEL